MATYDYWLNPDPDSSFASPVGRAEGFSSDNSWFVEVEDILSFWRNLGVQTV